MLPVMEVDGHAGTILAANQRMCEMLGYELGELSGLPLDVVIPERSQAQHKLDRAEYMTHPTPRPMGPDREVRMRCKDGEEITVWIGLAPDVEGNIVAAVIFVGGERPGPLNP